MAITIKNKPKKQSAIKNKSIQEKYDDSIVDYEGKYVFKENETIEDYNYNLPKELIAQEPEKKRSNCKLMIIKEDKIYHRRFYDIIDWLESGDVLVFNISKVMKARLLGMKEKTHGKVEFLVEPLTIDKNKVWGIFKGKNIKPKQVLVFIKGKKNYTAKVLERKENRLFLEFNENITKVMEEIGTMPTPPYIKKELESNSQYQTIYAKINGSMAAPTAGLHFDKDLIKKLKDKGIKFAEVILHVSYDTFLPVHEKDFKKHKMYGELCKIDEKNARIINEAKRSGKKVIAVGTTTVRTLETFSKNGIVYPGEKITRLFIYPGYKFQSPINGLITNFHLPKSTLLLLVSAFYGKNILKAYEIAVKKRYRFFSFGDAMLIFKKKSR